jgi:hypothetical protein
MDDIKFKSSSFATYSQYIAAPIIIGILIFQIYFYFIKGVAIDEESLFMLPFFVWASIFLIISINKLRYVKVYEKNIIIKTLKNESVIEYKDIEWINQNIFGSNWYILLIKYFDVASGKKKTIFIFPEMYTVRENFTIFGESNITKYTREQIIKANPSYLIQNEPSRWYLAKWIFLTLIPFVVFSFFLIM